MKKRILGLLAAVLVWPVLAAAQSSPPPGLSVGLSADCPSSMSAFGNAPGVVVGCYCHAGGPRDGAVWGSGPYTSDSSICNAALHTGVVGVEGGVVWIQLSKGLDAYQGTSANGVETQSYGPYATSMVIRAATQPNPCPKTMQGIEGTLSCTCRKGASQGGVWGTDIYTVDSDVCMAAVHAGVLPDGGGLVAVRSEPGRDAYQGSERNGVVSSDYGRWGASFRFLP